MNPLRLWVDELIKERYAGVATRLADAVGMSVSAFQRSTREEGTLSFENLLKLAGETGTSASKVLRLGGKTEQADLIERLYGEPNGLSNDATTVAHAFDSLPADAKNLILMIARAGKLLRSESETGSTGARPPDTKAATSRQTRRGDNRKR